MLKRLTLHYPRHVVRRKSLALRPRKTAEINSIPISTFAIFGVRGFIAAFISSELFDLMNDTLTAGVFKNSNHREKGKRQPIAALQIDGRSRAKTGDRKSEH